MDVLHTHLMKLREETDAESRLSQMIYMWRDGLPILFHSILLEESSISLRHLREFYNAVGLDSLQSLRTKKVFLTVSGFRIPMAGGRTLLHLAIEHAKEEIVEFLLTIGFESLPDDYHLLPEDLCDAEEIKTLLVQYNRSIASDKNARRMEAIKLQMKERPTADTFREPFVKHYDCPEISLPPIETLQVESLENGSVKVIRNFLTRDMREVILGLYESNKSPSNCMPNTMSKKGYSLRATKLETLGYSMSKALNPFAKLLSLPESKYPEIAHAFFVSYDSEAETLDKHRDGGFWTANLCLKAEDCDQLLEFDNEKLKMEEGMLVLHKGSVPHAVTGTCKGERVNLIFWFY